MDNATPGAEDFDRRAATWDDDPMRGRRALAVADAIRERLPLEGRSGLEYGCGTGLLSFVLQPFLRQLTLADNSPGMLEVLRAKIAANGVDNMRPLLLDLSVDPPPDERFDLVYSLMTFHHIPDTDRILRDLHALLAPSGHLCIADLDKEDGSFHNYEFHGHHGFERDDLARRARDSGFVDVEFSTVFHVRKGQPERDYPIFLMLARKA